PVVARPPGDSPRSGPREDAASGHAALHRHLELPVKDLGLPLFAVEIAGAVEADLAEDERARTRGMLQLGQVFVKRLACLEEDVERDEVRVVAVQILRGRIVRV